MKYDLNRNATQSAETQNKSTGKQYKASYMVSHSNPRFQDQEHDLKRIKYNTFP